MKILLIYPPVINQVSNINISAFDKTIGSYPPLGLLYIATYIKKFTNHNIEILDCFAKKMDFSDIRSQISNIKPDIIGIYAKTHFWPDVVKIAKISKQCLFDTKIIVGGPHAAIYPISIVKQEHIDYAIKGEGEKCFKDLVDLISNGNSEDEIAIIPGVASKLHLTQQKRNEDIELQSIINLNELPFPDRNIIDHKDYYSVFAEKGTFTTLITSRGCPFKCIYCDRLGKGFRFVSSENVIKEIKDCLNLGIRNFFIHDDTFTVNKKRVKEICDKIIQENFNINWEARSRVDCVDYELLKTMKQAGLSRLSFGVESGNEEILLKLRKGIKLNTVIEVFSWCKELKITTFADFMIGSPNETLKEIKDTIRLIKQIKPDYVQFSITCPYPATPLYKKLLEEGKITNDVWLEFAEAPSTNFVPPIASEYFNRKELEVLVTKAYKKVYFSLPFIFKELKKIKTSNMLLTRMKSALFLIKG